MKNKPQRALAELMRSCVQCGLCLPHCATYLATGDEVQSPRGRLLLLDDLLRSAGAKDQASYLAAFDQCIGCRACETVCPSGVPFQLLAHGQQLVSDHKVSLNSNLPEPAVPAAVLGRLDSPTFLKSLGALGAAARSVLRIAVGRDWRQTMERGPRAGAKFARLLTSLPTSPPDDGQLAAQLDRLIARANRPTNAAPRPVATEPTLESPKPLLFFSGCANAALLPGTSRRLIRCLEGVGYEVSIRPGQGCCGALAAHIGGNDRANALRQNNRAVFAADAEVPIVVEAAGCALELRSYSTEFAARVKDAVGLLAAARRPELRPVPLMVAFHDPCHARHGLGIIDSPRELLNAIPGLSWCEATEKEVCCGSGGAWGLRYPEISRDLARRKASDLAASGADLVVTTNPGCLGQIADGLALEAPDVPILPLTDLWWYAARGQL